jgi:hypothetical protein
MKIAIIGGTYGLIWLKLAPSLGDVTPVPKRRFAPLGKRFAFVAGNDGALHRLRHSGARSENPKSISPQSKPPNGFRARAMRARE